MTTRRKFIEKVSTAAIALPFFSLTNSSAHSATPFEPYKGPVLKIAILGIGSYSSRVARAIRNSSAVKITAAISGTPSKLMDWQSKYGIPESNCYNYENFDKIKDNPDIDAVYIVTPNSLHHPQTLRVAAAGKHVICEKPMAINAKQAQEMVDACKKANVKLLLGYRMHFEPNTLEIIQMRKDGKFGNIKYFQGLTGFRIGNPNQWRLNRELSGGGSLMDIGIYSINGARYMIGEEPVWVTAQETKTDFTKFREGIDETITFQMGFSSGVIASCLSTYGMNNLDKFFLNGDAGFAILDPAAGYGPIKGRTHLGDLNHKHVEHQLFQMEEMAKIIHQNANAIVPVNGEEGVRDMKIIDAIYLAAKNGQKVKLELSVH